MAKLFPFITNEKDYSLGILVSKELSEYETRYVYGTLKVRYYVGKQFIDSICKNLSKNINLKIINELPLRGEYDFVIYLSLNKGKSGTFCYSDLNQEIYVQRFSFSILIEIFDGKTFILKKRKAFQSMAAFSQDVRTTFSPDELDAPLPSRFNPAPLAAYFENSKFKKAIDRVVSELVQKISNFIINDTKDFNKNNKDY